MKTGKRPKFFYGYVVVLAAFIILVMTWGSIYSFGIFFKPVLIEFGWTRTVISGAYSLFFLSLGLFAGIAGKLSDRFGPKVVVSACGLLLGSGFLLMSQINTIWQLYLYYGVILGIGASGIYVPLASTIARWFVKRRGLITGIALSGISVGTMIVPLVASWLINEHGWRFSYLIVGIAVLLSIVSAAQFLSYDPSHRGMLPYGANIKKSEDTSLETRGYSLQEAIHTRQFWIISAIFFCFGFSAQTIFAHIVPHTTDIGISATSAANILTFIGAGGTVGRIIIGGVADRIGNKLSLITIFVLLSIALLWLLAARSIWAFYLFAVLFGLAYGGWAALISVVVADLFGLSSLGIILGVVQIGVTTGEAGGPILAGKIFDITSSYQPAFIVGLILSVTAIILALFLRPVADLRKGGSIDDRLS